MDVTQTGVWSDDDSMTKASRKEVAADAKVATVVAE